MRDWLKRHRAALILAALMVVGAIVGQAVAERNRDREGPPLTSTDAHPSGALALALWLERLGYPVKRIEQSSGALDDVGVLFVLLPLRSFDRSEAAALAGWVRRGGVLVYQPYPRLASSVLETSPRDPLASELGVDMRLVPFAPRAYPVGPFFTTPPATSFSLNTRWALDIHGDDWVPLVQEGDRVLAATRQLGEGRVYAVASEALFSNAAIAERDNAAFVSNVLARAPDRRTIAFEEAHHRPIEAPDLVSVMRVSDLRIPCLGWTAFRPSARTCVPPAAVVWRVHQRLCWPAAAGAGYGLAAEALCCARQAAHRGPAGRASGPACRRAGAASRRAPAH
jgi:hypothetical protein